MPIPHLVCYHHLVLRWQDILAHTWRGHLGALHCYMDIRKTSTVEPVLTDHPWLATRMWSVKTGGPWWQVQLYWNVGPSAKDVWSVKTGGLSWQWSQGRFHCNPIQWNLSLRDRCHVCLDRPHIFGRRTYKKLVTLKQNKTETKQRKVRYDAQVAGSFPENLMSICLTVSKKTGLTAADVWQ